MRLFKFIKNLHSGDCKSTVEALNHQLSFMGVKNTALARMIIELQDLVRADNATIEDLKRKISSLEYGIKHPHTLERGSIVVKTIEDRVRKGRGRPRKAQ